MSRSEYDANRYLGQRSWNSALRVAPVPKRLGLPWWGHSGCNARSLCGCASGELVGVV